jgi:hypothetical protein
MNQVILNEGKKYFAKRCFDGSVAEALDIVLYTNNYTPVDASVLANFTLATFTGSAPVNVATTDWGAPAIVANVAEITATPVPSWTNTGATTELCYGWVAVGAVSGLAYFAQRFDAARNMTPGSTESLDPFIERLKSFA